MPPLALLADFSWLAEPDRRFRSPTVPDVTKLGVSAPVTLSTRAERGSRWSQVERDIAAMLAASLAFALVGCATPVLKPSVDVPPRFAAAATTDAELEVAWWDSYDDPVLSDLIRRAARENRDVKIAAERVRAARAGETISRSWLFPSVGIQAAGFDQRTGYDSATKHAVPAAADSKSWQGGLERFLGSRHRGSSARGRGGRGRRHARGRRHGAWRSSARV